MNLSIHNTGVPIYAQITAQIKEQIITGALGEGEMIPSMRVLAKELRISVITTKRAYEELERDGFITSIPGKGSFVACKNRELIREENLKKIERLLREAHARSRQCGLTREELFEMLSLIQEEDRS